MSYQTILFVIRALPRQRETLDRFSKIIGAPFRSGARCSGVIIDAFNEFWGSAYVGVDEPEGGWPIPIQTALQASRQGNQASSVGPDSETLDPVDNNPPSDQSLTQEVIDDAPKEIPSRDRTKSGKPAGITLAEYPIRTNLQGPTTPCKSPSTPRRERKPRVSTPPRRQRTSSLPKTLHTLGPEPRSPLTDLRKRNPASHHTSPTPKVSDKENVSPKPLPDIFASVLGKRKMDPTVEDLTSYAKRKINSSGSLKTARDSENSKVVAKEGPTEGTGDYVLNTPSKKRKSEVFAGVVVPTVKEVMLRRRHSAPLKEEADTQSPNRLAFTSAANLKKSRMNVADHRNGDDLEASPRKKIRTVRSDEPITHMVDFPLIGSGNATRLHLNDGF